MYRVFRLPPNLSTKADLLFQDDIVGRQSISVRDAKSLGLEGNDRYVVIEGTEAALVRATELLKDAAPPLKPTEAESVYRRFQSQDEEAASGIGLIFGQ